MRWKHCTDFSSGRVPHEVNFDSTVVAVDSIYFLSLKNGVLVHKLLFI